MNNSIPYDNSRHFSAGHTVSHCCGDTSCEDAGLEMLVLPSQVSRGVQRWGDSLYYIHFTFKPKRRSSTRQTTEGNGSFLIFFMSLVEAAGFSGGYFLIKC